MEALAPASVVRHLTLLRAILNRAIRDGRISSSPTRCVKWPKENNVRVRCLTDYEEARLMAALPERLRQPVALDLNTGMRRGELFALSWKDIELVNRTIMPRDRLHGAYHRPTTEGLRLNPAACPTLAQR